MLLRSFLLFLLIFALALQFDVAAARKSNNDKNSKGGRGSKGGRNSNSKNDRGSKKDKPCRDASECHLYRKSDFCMNPSMSHLWKKCPKKCGYC
ncbi:hypothetical protein Y032_0330g2705 [Ancylostoma ceylanicum]|uniref:ShKT domain-containing protein n=1 Tax=Ancylostoma ceylanicum TaxID=53326 RepID=A0A016S078_9BILA|nr:hypothetical protein Y032_0330g2705 [Ancylostoma ceylanicum]